LALDEILAPPESREIFSPNRRYILKILTKDKWRSGIAVAELYRSEEDTHKLLWREQLPYRFGSRFALVDDNGSSVLIDEWLNIKSKHAVIIFNLNGRIIADYDFTDIRKVLGTSKKTLIDHAERGWWVAGAPLFRNDNQFIFVPAGGKFLRIRVSDGSLSVASKDVF